MKGDSISIIAAVLEDKFEDVEFTKPAEAFRERGHKVVTVGMEKGKVVKGKSKGTEVEIDISFEEADASEFDALFIPGGYSPDKLRAHEKPVEFARKFVEGNRPVFMICHGAQLLITADVLKGRKVTGWKSIKRDIINAGAEFVDEEAVVDGNLVSSRNPDDIPAFINASLEKL